jgi:1-acyl-sn-glycerol-3-phosphate acyltransferase
MISPPLRSHGLAALRLAGYALWTGVMLGPVLLANRLAPRRAERLLLRYWRASNRLLGLRATVRGAPCTARPCLFVANHVSYVDIVLLGAVLPANFIAKREVAGWPVFGFLAKAQRTVFIERRGASSSRQRDALVQRLAAGDNLVLFPEGTSSDGNRVLRFKSALFAAAEHGTELPLAVQPVSVAYVGLDGMPLGRHLRPLVGWFGAMDLVPHLWAMLGLGRIEAELRFHPPVRIAAFASRKALAEHCQAAVASGVAAALAGREPAAEAVAPLPAPLAEAAD